MRPRGPLTSARPWSTSQQASRAARKPYVAQCRDGRRRIFAETLGRHNGDRGFSMAA